MNTQESNKIIARFMGGMECICGKSDCDNIQFDSMWYAPHELQYHTSWGWLMPVVAKCRLIVAEGKYDKVPGEMKNLIDMSICASIETVYVRVLQFIQWYNQQQTDK